MANIKDKFTKNGATIIASAITALGTFLWSQYSQHAKEAELHEIINNQTSEINILKAMQDTTNIRLDNRKEGQSQIVKDLSITNERVCALEVKQARLEAGQECQEKLRDLELRYRKK